MQPELCSKCKNKSAVIFITKVENGGSTNEGLCLKCAKDLNIKPVEDIIRKMGLTDEDLDSLTDEMLTEISSTENQTEAASKWREGKTADFPFLKRLFDEADEPPCQLELPRLSREPEDKASSIGPKDAVISVHPARCAECEKNLAVIFITKIENGESTNEGLCLRCARTMNIKPVEDIIKKMGLTDEDIDKLTIEMQEAMNNAEQAKTANNENDVRSAAFPFLKKLFDEPEEPPKN